MRASPVNGGASRREKLLLLFLLALLVMAGLVYFEPLRDAAQRATRFMLDKEGARAWIQARQPYSALYYLGLCLLQVVISPIPGEVSGFLGGLVFGWSYGFIYATIGLTVGSLFNVVVGRVFERVFLERFISKRTLDAFEARVHRWGLTTVFILFLIPGSPKDVLCYLFGLSRIPIFRFLFVSSLARMPGTLVLCLQGAEVFEGDWTYFAAVTGGALAVLIPALIYKDRLLRRLGVLDQADRPE